MKSNIINIKLVLRFLSLLSFLLLTNCSKSDSKSIDKSTRPDLYTYVPDDNFEQLLINQGYDDRLDNYITNADVVDVTMLLFTNGGNGIIDSSGIGNFTGIEAFVSLESFDCSFLNLSYLDLSHNTALKSINCSANNLTSLDLSNLTQLESLSCGYNNLDVLLLNSASLVSLSCNVNNLEDLDVSQATNLISLACFDNELTSLDLSNNINLNSLQVGQNLFETLDISQNIALEYVDCQLNPMLTCVQVNEDQFAENWTFCSSELFALSCD